MWRVKCRFLWDNFKPRCCTNIICYRKKSKWRRRQSKYLACLWPWNRRFLHLPQKKSKSPAIPFPRQVPFWIDFMGSDKIINYGFYQHKILHQIACCNFLSVWSRHWSSTILPFVLHVVNRLLPPLLYLAIHTTKRGTFFGAKVERKSNVEKWDNVVN